MDHALEITLTLCNVRNHAYISLDPHTLQGGHLSKARVPNQTSESAAFAKLPYGTVDTTALRFMLWAILGGSITTFGSISRRCFASPVRSAIDGQWPTGMVR